MKLSKKIILLLLLSPSLGATPFKVMVDQQNNPLSFIYDHVSLRASNALTTFQSAAIHFERFLEDVSIVKKPIIILVPTTIEHVSTLAEDAPYTESARVALSWASAFSRFEELGNLDIRIVKTDTTMQDDNSFKHALLNILNTPSHNFTSIYQRICTLDEQNIPSPEMEQKNTYTVRPYFFNTNQQESQKLSVTLPERTKNQSIFFVTGAAGFIGSHLCKKLLKEGHQVIGLDNYACCNRTNLISCFENPCFCFIEADVTVPFEIESSVDYVLHLASIPSPKYYYNMPRETLHTGLHGTKNTLDLAVKKNARYLFASTSEVYGDPEVSPQHEAYCGNVDPIGMRSQYDQSKRGGETLIKIYVDEHGIDARIARIFNTYGPGMQLNDGRVITNFIQAYLSKKSLTIYGDGNQTRSFAYVSDTADGIYRLVVSNALDKNTPLVEKVFNIGTPEEFTINKLAAVLNELLIAQAEQPCPIEHVPQFDATDPKQRLPNIERAKRSLEFFPSIELKEGLRETLSFFKGLY